MNILLQALCLLLTFMSSCNAMTRTVAERCVWVDLYGQNGKELIPLLDVFAEQNNLLPEKSHPINPRYERRDEKGALIGEVSYLIGVGEFGAQLVLFRFDKTQNADLLDAFDRLAEDNIAQRYNVTPCSDAQLPEVYR